MNAIYNYNTTIMNKLILYCNMYNHNIFILLFYFNKYRILIVYSYLNNLYK